MSVTRKLAEILAADVVRFSKLICEDEARTARVVRKCPDTAGPVNY
jgi:hypothetical protein